MALKAVAPNATLKTMGEPSSTDRMLSLIADAMRTHGVEAKTICLAEHNIPAGVKLKKGAADDWPAGKIASARPVSGEG